MGKGLWDPSLNGRHTVYIQFSDVNTHLKHTDQVTVLRDTEYLDPTIVILSQREGRGREAGGEARLHSPWFVQHR